MAMGFEFILSAFSYKGENVMEIGPLGLLKRINAKLLWRKFSNISHIDFSPQKRA